MEAKDVAMGLAQLIRSARHVHQHKTGVPGHSVAAPGHTSSKNAEADC